MFRFTLFPVFILISTVLFGIISYFVFNKIKRVLSSAYKKSAELAAKKQQQWKDKDNRKHFPDMLQQGFSRFEVINQATQKLPIEWSEPLQPLVSQTRQILDELAFQVESIDSNKQLTDDKKSHKKNDVINAMRTFFIHTVDALQQFVEKIHQDAQHMTPNQINKAQENIQILAADLAHHQQLLDKKRKFDFDVLMDVIKARLKT